MAYLIWLKIGLLFYLVLPGTMQGSVIRVQGDEFWHMTKVLRLSTNDR